MVVRNWAAIRGTSRTMCLNVGSGDSRRVSIANEDALCSVDALSGRVWRRASFMALSTQPIAGFGYPLSIWLL